jgi:hypothetical protein
LQSLEPRTRLRAETAAAQCRWHLGFALLLLLVAVLDSLVYDAHHVGQGAHDRPRHHSTRHWTADPTTLVAAGIISIGQGKASETPLEPREEGRCLFHDDRPWVAVEHGKPTHPPQRDAMGQGLSSHLVV